VYVAQAEQQANIEVQAAMPAPVKKSKSFAAGMCTMLVVSVATAWGWHTLLRPDHCKLSSQPHWRRYLALTPAQLDALRQRSSLSPR
jgi:type VI secretion system protein VasL